MEPDSEGLLPRLGGPHCTLGKCLRLAQICGFTEEAAWQSLPHSPPVPTAVLANANPEGHCFATWQGQPQASSANGSAGSLDGGVLCPALGTQLAGWLLPDLPQLPQPTAPRGVPSLPTGTTPAVTGCPHRRPHMEFWKPGPFPTPHAHSPVLSESPPIPCPAEGP